MTTAPANPDVGGLLEPGVFTSFSIGGGGAAITNTNQSAHLMGYRLTSGAGVADVPTLYTNRTDLIADHGSGSECVRLWDAFQAQGVNAEVWVTGITPPSGGTEASYTLTFAGPATAAGWRSIAVNGYVARVNFASGDTATAIATALYRQRALLADSGVSVTDSGSGTLTLTYKHKGVTGNDCPVVLDGSTGDGVTVSNGVITYATSPSGSAGSATVTIGATTISVSIDPAVETTAALVATKVYTAIAAGNYPITATDNGSGVLTVYPRYGRAVRRLSAAIVTTGGVTATVSLHGTSGVGVPTLTTALANAANLARGWAAWVTPFVDAGGGTGALDKLTVHREAEGNGVVQKNQCLFVASCDKLATAGALTTASTPALTAMQNSGNAVYWVKDGPQQAFEYAARYAAIYIGQAYYAQNLDGIVLKTSGSVPLGVPHLADRPGRTDREAAMSVYYMTVGFVNGRSQLTIERAMDTSNASNATFRELPTIRQLHTFRPRLNQKLIDTFSGKSIRFSGTPKTTNTVTLDSVKDCVYSLLLDMDGEDLFDGAEAWKAKIVVSRDPDVVGRVRVFVPLAVLVALHQITPVVAPSTSN